MQYLIMFLIVLGVTISDVITGWLKAHIQKNYDSTVMRIGLYNKFMEWVIMATMIGLDVGLEMLGKYYSVETFSSIVGLIGATSIFIYILIMEVISILENLAQANPDATFAKALSKKLKKLQNLDDKED